MRKKVALLLTAAMTMSLLAGCGSDSVSGENNAADITAGVSEDGTVDPRFKYEEPVTLTSYFEISGGNAELCLLSAPGRGDQYYD